MNIIKLPQDILFVICINLDPRDLLSFIQTCRVIHAYGSADYVWHQIKGLPPLDKEDALVDLSGTEIKRSVIRALRLDANWRKRVSKITRISKINTRNTNAVEIRPLGPNYLATSHRISGPSMNVSIWRLTETSSSIVSSRVISLDPEGRAFSFHASLQEDGNTALITILGGQSVPSPKGQIVVYHINLQESIEQISPLLNQWTIHHNGVIYFADISGPIVAAAILHMSQTPCTHQIILFNTETNMLIRLDAPITFEAGRMQFKIFRRKLVIVGVNSERIKVCVCQIPAKLFSTEIIPLSLDEETLHSEKWDPLIAEYETERIRNMEFYISEEPFGKATPQYMTVMAVHSPFSMMQDGNVNLYYFPIDDRFPPGQKFTAWKRTHSFDTPPNVTLEPACVGKTGCRAVWLSHQWNTDDFRLMKGSFSATDPPLVVSLQPPEQALPFQAHTCRSLYFENNTGRLFVGVHTGEIYILQF